MKEIMANFFMSVGVTTVLVLLVVIGFLIYAWIMRRTLPEYIILEANFERHYVESLPEDPLERLSLRRTPRLFDVTAALARATEDDRVAVLVAKVGTSPMRTAKIEEIREAVLKFRASGKQAIAYAETFGEFGPGNNAYHLATAFDRIYLQPSGDLGLTGMSTKTPFIRTLLEKVGVQPSLDHRKEYKSAAYIFTENQYTAPHREADRAVLESIMSGMVDDIARSRGLSAEKVLDLVGQGPFTAEQALDAALIDGLAYRDQVYDEINKRADATARPISLSHYLRRAGSPFTGRKKIALIYGEGQILRGKNRRLPPGRQVMGSDTVAEAFRKAVEDQSVQAIIFRINSPGGSYVASDTVRRAIARARQEGKPVIASMSEVAGSGGYFMAVSADKIIAYPGTITGSIGVVSGKMVTSGLWNKLGVNWGELCTHENALFWSSTESYSAEQWETLQKWLDNVYHDFVKKVAEGRNLDPAKVHAIAKGRIWSGTDAKSLGLVDELGGFAAAVQAAKSMAQIAPEEHVGIRTFPVRRPLWKRLFSARQDSEEAPAFAWTDIADPLTAFAGEAGLFEPPGVLQMRILMVE